MGIYAYEAEVRHLTINHVTRDYLVYPNDEFDRFRPSILELGRINRPSTQVNAVAAVFDLTGFTRFCNQPDPHLEVPRYLGQFLDWLFVEIKAQVVVRMHRNYRILYAELPFVAKFLGDGVLFLWDTEKLDEVGICNIPSMLLSICSDYATDFYPQIKTTAVNPPKALRCGVARGVICSIGNEKDYVGPCINIASRLQKLSNLQFCCSCRGFDFDRHSSRRTRRLFIRKRTELRGIGKNELVWVVESQFDNLPTEEKGQFRQL